MLSTVHFLRHTPSYRFYILNTSRACRDVVAMQRSVQGGALLPPENQHTPRSSWNDVEALLFGCYCSEVGFQRRTETQKKENVRDPPSHVLTLEYTFETRAQVNW